MAPLTESRIRDRLAVVKGRIADALHRSGREPEETKVLIATKYYEADQLSALLGAGVGLVGENRAEDLIRKQEVFGDAFEWHFIGHVQRRKAKTVVPRVSLIHSVDSARLVEGLARRAAESGIDVLFQVNVSGEFSKSGVADDEVDDLVEGGAGT